MDIIKQIAVRLEEEKKKIGVTDIVVFESTNGFILASTVSEGTVDFESIGSLTSGALTALGMLSDLFSAGKIAALVTETAEGVMVFQHIEEHYFLCAIAPRGRRVGYLQMHLAKSAAALKDLVAQFIAASDVKISDLDIEQIQISLDAQFDDLFKEGK